MTKPSNILIVIGGSTAVGKTALSIQLAQAFDCHILSADSRQLFNELNIGTAKASSQTLETVPHHFINHLSIKDNYSVGSYEKEAIALLDTLFESNPIQILCGGSGLYINALCKGLDKFPDIPTSVNDELNQLLENDGISALQLLLKEKDPSYYNQVDLENPRRLLRALSVILHTGKTFTSFWNQCDAARNFTPIYILLEEQRSILYERINKRVDQMVENGLESEARVVYPFRSMKSLQTVGYQEWFDYFEGKITRDKAIEYIKRNTRRYAKRQGTWFRRDSHWNSFHSKQASEIIDFVKNQIKELQSA